MDVFGWIRRHKFRFWGIAIVLVIIIPWLIDRCFSVPAYFAVLGVRYAPNDILAFYGIVLGSITTIIALIETIQHAEKMHALDYEHKLTPVLNSNIYNNSPTNKIPMRVLYVNVTSHCLF